MRNKKIYLSYFFEFTMVGLLIALVFNNTEQTPKGIKNRLGSFFVLSTFGTLSAVNISVLICKYYIFNVIVCEERKVFIRERASYLYTPLAYYISKFVSLMPICFITQSLLSCILYYSANLNSTHGYKFWIFTMILIVCYNCGNIYTLFLASLSKNQEVLVAIGIVSY